MLYLVSTPIGHLSDITYRAVLVLKKSDYILCEDTRRSRVLLSHYAVRRPLKSFHQFSEASKEEAIICDLKAGKTLSLISDAGTPGISDPGERLVKRCRSEALTVSPIPGPSAAIAALSASGLSTSPFQFFGFLPRKKGELQTALITILQYRGTTVCYESPKRASVVVRAIKNLDPKRPLVIARELTKTYEEFLFGTPDKLLDLLGKNPIKGELVLLISGDPSFAYKSWKQLSPLEHVDYLIKVFKLTDKDAVKLAAELRGAPKRDVYRQLHKKD